MFLGHFNFINTNKLEIFSTEKSWHSTAKFTQLYAPALPFPSLFLSLCLSLSLNFVRNLCVFTGPEAASIIEFRTCTCHTYFCRLHCLPLALPLPPPPCPSLYYLSKCIADITFILTVPFSVGGVAQRVNFTNSSNGPRA